MDLLPPPVPPLWDSERDDALTCVAVRAETHDVATFVFAPDEPRLFRFLPGQFMTFEIPLGGRTVQRCYTIASPPTRPWRIEITAKRTPGGPASNWLHDAVRPGTRVRASGPMGDFTFGARPRGKYLFLSAGSGITPLMSMARTLHDLGGGAGSDDADVLFVHSARSPADLIFSDELAAMTRRPGFRSVAVIEADAPGARWGGYRGRLSPAMLALIAPDLPEREAFCCGPEPYMASVRAMLDAAGFDRSRHHEESFSFGADTDPEPVPLATTAPAFDPAPRAAPRAPLPARDGAGDRAPSGSDAARPPTGRAPAVPRTPAPAAAGTHAPIQPEPAAGAAAAPAAESGPGDGAEVRAFTVRFARTGRDIPCGSGTTVLAAARAAGIRLPSACAKGVCGTCKSRLLSGTVEMRHGGGIRQREIDAGLALLCCARPTGDLVVDR